MARHGWMPIEAMSDAIHGSKMVSENRELPQNRGTDNERHEAGTKDIEGEIDRTSDTANCR